jgi:hypothetical protein
MTSGNDVMNIYKGALHLMIKDLESRVENENGRKNNSRPFGRGVDEMVARATKRVQVLTVGEKVTA